MLETTRVISAQFVVCKGCYRKKCDNVVSISVEGSAEWNCNCGL